VNTQKIVAVVLVLLGAYLVYKNFSTAKSIV